jgi:hypothetical protein
MISTFLTWETVKSKHNGWSFQLLEAHREEDMAILLSSLSHTFLCLEETLDKRQSMMSGAWVLKKLLSPGLSLIVEKLNHRSEFITQLLFVQQVALLAWWLFSVEELVIKAVLTIPGVSENTEMEDGIGLKLHTSHKPKVLSQDINIQHYSWVLLW